MFIQEINTSVTKKLHTYFIVLNKPERFPGVTMMKKSHVTCLLIIIL
jgi:hypothetical protein